MAFAVSVVKLTEGLPNRKAFNHLGGQLLRSGTAPALIYGEAQAAESDKDFLHKIKLVLKELRETQVGLKIMMKLSPPGTQLPMGEVLGECSELVAIFTASVKKVKAKAPK
ncbi:MAG: four helix bundle protein [Bacteroidota bacterium]